MLRNVEGYSEEKNGIKYFVFDFCFLSKLSTTYILTNRTINIYIYI